MISGAGKLSLIYFGIILILFKLAPTIMLAMILGVYFATIIEEPEKILSKKINPVLAKIISYTLVISAVVYAISNFFPVIINQGKIIFENLSGVDFSSQETTLEIPDEFFQFLNEFKSTITSFGLNILNNIVTSIPSLVAGSVIIIITTVIMGTLKKRVNNNLWKLYPVDTLNGINFMKKTITDFETFIKGQALDALIIGLLVGLGAYIFKIPGAFFIGVLAWITNFIPYLGVVIAAIPMLMLGFATHGVKGIIIVIAILVVVNQAEIWFIAPKIQSSSLKIHWYIILVAILLFGQLFQLAGIFIAIPTIIYIRNFWRFFMIKK